jgi:hypothetical protein
MWNVTELLSTPVFNVPIAPAPDDKNDSYLRGTYLERNY